MRKKKSPNKNKKRKVKHLGKVVFASSTLLISSIECSNFTNPDDEAFDGSSLSPTSDDNTYW